MKKFVPLLLVPGLVGIALGNYTLVLNGVTNSVDLGQAKSITLPDGQQIEVLLHQDPQSVFTAEFFSFHHDNSLVVSSDEIGEGIQQTLLTTPRGTLILVQQYADTNPVDLLEIMLEQITQKDVDADYDVHKEKTSRMAGEMEINGLRCVSSKDHESWTRDVLSCSVGERGVLIITALETMNNSREQEILDLFWESLTVSIPKSVDEPESK